MTSSNGNIFRITGNLCGEIPGNSPHKGQWRGALMFSLICARINGWVNNGEAGDLRLHRAHYDVIVMIIWSWEEWSALYCILNCFSEHTRKQNLFVIDIKNIVWKSNRRCLLTSGIMFDGHITARIPPHIADGKYDFCYIGISICYFRWSEGSDIVGLVYDQVQFAMLYRGCIQYDPP